MYSSWGLTKTLYTHLSIKVMRFWHFFVGANPRARSALAVSYVLNMSVIPQVELQSDAKIFKVVRG